MYAYYPTSGYYIVNLQLLPVYTNPVSFFRMKKRRKRNKDQAWNGNRAASVCMHVIILRVKFCQWGGTNPRIVALMGLYVFDNVF